jgi:hypothetical protein
MLHRPSFHVVQLGTHSKDFHEVLYLTIFGESVEKIHVSLKSDKNNGALYSFAALAVFRSFQTALVLQNSSLRSSHSLRAGQSGDWIPLVTTFPASIQTGDGTYPSSCKINTICLFPSCKEARAWRWLPPPPFSDEVKERIDLYLHLLSESSRCVLGRTLSLLALWYKCVCQCSALCFAWKFVRVLMMASL